MAKIKVGSVSYQYAFENDCPKVSSAGSKRHLSPNLVRSGAAVGPFIQLKIDELEMRFTFVFLRLAGRE